MSKEGHIIAMGGGGFSHYGFTTALDRFALKLAREVSGISRPNICFVPTASGDSEFYSERFEHAFAAENCQTHVLSLFRNAGADLEEEVRKQDLIYVGGGNTRNMLVLWREWGLDRMFRKHWESGKVLAGISAGSICWFEKGLTDSVAGELGPLNCLSFLPGSNCPHYDGEAHRRPRLHECISAGKMPAGIACDDGAAVYFKGLQFEEAIADTEGASAYRVVNGIAGIAESQIETRLIKEEE